MSWRENKTDEERRGRLENDTATKRLGFAMETDEERKARQEKMVATMELRLALETEEERRAKMEWILFGFDLDFILIEIIVLKNNFLKERVCSLCNGNRFSS